MHNTWNPESGSVLNKSEKIVFVSGSPSIIVSLWSHRLTGQSALRNQELCEVLTNTTRQSRSASMKFIRLAESVNLHV
jgi:hypothetical protein